MKVENQQLLTFLFKLLEARIKKYVELPRIGIGPDASMNAKLIADEVTELMNLAQNFLEKIETNNLDNSFFISTLQQIKFSLDQEYLRGRAGWIIDANSIHNAGFAHVCAQIKELDALLALRSTQAFTVFEATTETQRQCEYDSHVIAYLILDTATTLIDDPKAELKNEIPSHALTIMRRHAMLDGRYHQTEIQQEIYASHFACTQFLEKSTLIKSTTKLTMASAQDMAEKHRSEMSSLLSRFDSLVPEQASSKHLQLHDKDKAKRNVIETKKETLGYYKCNSTLFKVALATAAVAATSVIAMTLRQ